MDTETRQEFKCVKELLGDIRTDQAVIGEHLKTQGKRIGCLEKDVKPLHEEYVFQRKNKERFRSVSIYLAPASTLVAIALGLVLLSNAIK